jgi:hypothetical protein
MPEIVETELLRTALRPLRDQRLPVVDALNDDEAEAMRRMARLTARKRT